MNKNLPVYTGISLATGVIDGAIVAGTVAAITGQALSIPIFVTVGAFAGFVAFSTLAVLNSSGNR